MCNVGAAERRPLSSTARGAVSALGPRRAAGARAHIIMADGSMPPPPPRTPSALHTTNASEPVRVMLVRLQCCEHNKAKLAQCTTVYDLRQRPVTLAGRARKCQINVANDPVISRTHAEFRFKEARSRAAHERARALGRRFRTGYTITDVSANGVYVNGSRVQQEGMDLYAGDVLVFAYTDKVRRYMYHVYVQGGDTPKNVYDSSALVDALAKPAHYNVDAAPSPVARGGQPAASSPPPDGGDSPTQNIAQVRFCHVQCVWVTHRTTRQAPTDVGASTDDGTRSIVCDCRLRPLWHK